MESLVLTQNLLTPIKQSLIDGMVIASGAKSSATYYHGKKEQLDSIKSNVKSLYSLSKELPLLIAVQKGVTGKFISEVLLNEFKNTANGGACNIVNPIDWYDNGLSDKAILTALNNLNENNGFPYVLRLFIDIKNNKINNERSRKIILGFILGQNNLEFYSMKYRNKIAEILRHVYGRKMTSVLLSISKKRIIERFLHEKEFGFLRENLLKYSDLNTDNLLKLFLFILKANDASIDYNEFTLISEYQKAKTDITNVKYVPEEVLIGLISNKKHPQFSTMWSNKDQIESTKALIRKNVMVTSVNQQVRQTKSTEKLGVSKVVNYDKVTDFLAFYKTGYENGFTDEINQAIDKLADKQKFNGFHYNNVGVILDDSISMTGNKNESKNTPKAIADFTARIISKSVQYFRLCKTEGVVTDLGSSFIELLKAEDSSNQYDAIFVITDGYENSYDGLLNEIVVHWKAITGRNIPVFQISPILGSETGGRVRNLGSDFITMAINNPVSLLPQINARLLEVDAKKWIESQLIGLISSKIKRINKINVNVQNSELW